MTAVVVSAGLVLIAGAVFLAAVCNGFALWLLWGWFMVPLGIPPIGIAWAVGLSTVATMLLPSPSRAKSDGGEWYIPLLELLGKPALALLVGWVAKSFM